jgi:phosphoglycerol transferase MdoB-like AlkP superfamily enzyme
MSWKVHDVDSDENNDISVFNIPCLIYDKKIAAKYRQLESITDTTSSIINERFMSAMDIYPTLCNVLGLDYNTKLAYGVSLFEDTPHVFITFKDSGYVFNDEFLFDGVNIVAQGTNQDSTEFIALKNEIVDKYNKMETLYKHEKSFANVMNKLEES